MIIVRSPLRITFGGGGTDLASYYSDHGGFLVAAAIDKYVYIMIHNTFQQEISLKYSRIERVKSVEQVEHPILRESLRLMEFVDPSLEITSVADIPAGTGLGSSGSFTTGLLRALHAHRGDTISPHQLAEQACEVEIERLREPIGKQDQFIAAYGGIRSFEFAKDGKVETRSVRLSEEVLFNLEDNLLMFFTGITRSASALLKDQDQRSRSGNTAMLDSLHYAKELGYRSLQALEDGDISRFGRLMHEHWEHKRKRSAGMSSSEIDGWYELAKANGAIGGKVIGAGGGGFLLFVAEDKARLRSAMRRAGLKEVRFRFDFEGTKVVAQ